jgi:uncharacterized protein
MPAPVMTRRHFLLKAAAAGAVAAAGAGVYSRWLEPRWLEVTQHRLALNPAPDARPLKLLHLSDLHASRYVPLAYISAAIATGLALKPDLICVTGDFVTCAEAVPDGYAQVLRALPEAAPTFASLGNHDGGLWTRRRGGAASNASVLGLLAAAGIPCLDNALTELSLHGRRVQLAGLGDLWNNDCDPHKTFGPSGAGSRPPRVLLSHNPDTKTLLRAHDWNLMLSGHTHGGQIGLPVLARRFAPVADKNFLSGLHRWEDRWIYVSKGVGAHLGVRFACRPEITLLTLTV